MVNLATAVHQLGSCRYDPQQMAMLKGNGTFRALLAAVREWPARRMGRSLRRRSWRLPGLPGLSPAALLSPTRPRRHALSARPQVPGPCRHCRRH
jgi:hypothetical protein